MNNQERIVNSDIFVRVLFPSSAALQDDNQKWEGESANISLRCSLIDPAVIS
jgi:hypothetical protein